MAQAQPARAPRRDPVPRGRPRSKPRVVSGGARGIRWDRLSRVALLVVLVVLVLLYIGPARSYWSSQQEAKQRRAHVAELKRENAELRSRRAALSSPGALEREARRLGMVRSGERSYAIENLPR
jgi:cell division protein FtsB